jgi:hypothetical protein
MEGQRIKTGTRGRKGQRGGVRKRKEKRKVLGGEGRGWKNGPAPCLLDPPVFRLVGREPSVHNWYVEGYLERLEN